MDISKALDKFKELQGKLKETQDYLATVSESGEAGGGMVKVTVNGLKELIKIEIDDEIYDANNKEVLVGLLIAATNQAITKAEGKIKSEMRKNTEGMLPNIPIPFF